MPTGLFAICAAMAAENPQGATTYRSPSPAVEAIVDASPEPDLNIAPQGNAVLLSTQRSLPGIDLLATPRLTLGGLQINPQTHGLAGTPLLWSTRYVRFEVFDPESRQLRSFAGIPAKNLGDPLWAPNGKAFLFTHVSSTGTELWLADIPSATARKVTEEPLNFSRGTSPPCAWMPDSVSLICKSIPSEFRAPLTASVESAGPVVQETVQAHAPLQSYGSLLAAYSDELRYEYFATSQLVALDVKTGLRRPIGRPAIFDAVKPSPDGKYLLAVRVMKPYSYAVPENLFARNFEILDLDGKLVRTVGHRPVDLSNIVDFDSVPSGPRQLGWAPLKPATLAYVESIGSSGPGEKDSLRILAAPFADDPKEVLRVRGRISERVSPFVWGSKGELLIREYQPAESMNRVWLSRDAGGTETPTLLWQFGVEARYEFPGEPMTTQSPMGADQQMLVQRDDWIYLSGMEASEDGDCPYLDRFNLATSKRQRVFTCKAGSYERPVAVLDPDAKRYVTHHQSKRELPNLYLNDRKAGKRYAMTRRTDPSPDLTNVRVEYLNFVRKDGVKLSGELNYPVGYKRGDKVPVVIWGYPVDYATAEAASASAGSRNMYVGSIAGFSPKYLLLHGYAVLDHASMPIVGARNANDSYVAQLSANAEAAVQATLATGITRPGMIGVAGHSYGAVMVGSLLAHTKLFGAGMAMSGSYNQTLSPFGLQSEQRSFWEARDAYRQLSAFDAADNIKAPLLLIHGADDQNPGTPLMQSERLYKAIAGLGGTARLVVLPHEDHIYLSRESVLHSVAEMFDWFDRFLKEQ
ncbi:MAG: prolyl oligopeptidase family serine peptidase [Gammaproteobacteria bacterium]